MDSILSDINAIYGVIGSFVCDGDGALLAVAVPPGSGNGTAQGCAASSVAQIVTGLKSVSLSDVGEVDLHCSNGRLVVKVSGSGCLCILCAPHADVSQVNLTANVAARKLGRMIKELPKRKTIPEQSSPEQGPGREPAMAQSTEGILEKVLDLWT
jgi:predicted regulator of Ras-like GTPase activity (Roadblock/LC7/MglB family)